MGDTCEVRRVSRFLGAVLVITACTDPEGGTEDVGAASDGSDCKASEVTVRDDGFPEVAGAGDGAEMWALLWDEPPWPVDHEVKVVWRMTGSGEFTVRAIGPEGESVAPTRGPTPHSGSTWDRPGEEWGTFFSLPSDGCWTLEARRSDDASTIGVVVGPA
jgi:hypothetical protein